MSSRYTGPVAIFFAQAANHLIWYVSMRAAVAHNVRLTVVLDAAYSVLLVLVLQKIKTAKWSEWLALLFGGAVGTWIGLKIGV